MDYEIRVSGIIGFQVHRIIMCFREGRMAGIGIDNMAYDETRTWELIFSGDPCCATTVLVMNVYRRTDRSPVIKPFCIFRSKVYAATAHRRSKIVMPIGSMKTILIIEEHHPWNIR